MQYGKWRFLIKWIFVPLLAIYSTFLTTASAEGLLGDDLPNFNLPTLSGSRLTNKSLQGHVSLLNIWGSWCKYCYYEHPMLMKIKNTYKIPIYGIDLKDNVINAKIWLHNYGNPYISVGEDFSGVTSDMLNVYGTPQTFVIDKNGKIRYRYNGGIDQGGWDDTLWPLIQKLEAEK